MVCGRLEKSIRGIISGVEPGGGIDLSLFSWFSLQHCGNFEIDKIEETGHCLTMCEYRAGRMKSIFGLL